jgi:tetrahydromethanopterin S-methyltransferase subunit E
LEERALDNPLFRFLAIRAGVGIATGWAVLAAFIVLDVASLRTLMAQTGSTLPAMVLLAVFFAITFGSCAMGLGVMFATGEDKPQPPRGRRTPALGVVAPVRVRAGR